ncbi:MAG: lysophospholipid acyltransferase family protein [Spirochaetia bacterium]
MIGTTLFFLYVIFYFILSLIFLIPYPFLFPFGRKVRQKYTQACVSTWGKAMLVGAGSKIEAVNQENVPKHGKICFVGNHQSYADIPLLLGYSGRLIGFVAKKELAFIPLLNLWMKMIGCVFLDRKSRRSAVEVMNKAVEKVKKEYPMLIFPEGTRSKGRPVGSFRTGSFKLPKRAKASIIPFTIIDSYKVYEEKKKISRANIKVIFHEPIPFETYKDWENQELSDKVREIIVSPLPEDMRRRESE